MNPDRDDERLESYLRQFQARAPRPLALRKRRSLFRPPLAIAAMAAVLVIVLSLWLPRRQQPGKETAQMRQRPTPVAEEISFARLSYFARQEPDKLDGRLNELSAKTLPDVRSSQGVLKRLAGE